MPFESVMQPPEEVLEGEAKKTPEELARTLRSVLKHGCKGCSSFKCCAVGDDDVGVCTAGEKPVVLDESPLSFRYGTYGGVGGDGRTFYPGTKYYPHEGCKYLKEV